eukprot:764150-Hanusia_phi.AAC.1
MPQRARHEGGGEGERRWRMEVWHGLAEEAEVEVEVLEGRWQDVGCVAVQGEGRQVIVGGPRWGGVGVDEEEVRGEIVKVCADESNPSEGWATMIGETCGSVYFDLCCVRNGFDVKEGARVKAIRKKRNASVAISNRSKKADIAKEDPASLRRNVRFVSGLKFSPIETDAELLHNAVSSALQQLDRTACQSVALPALGSKDWGFPSDQSASITIDACMQFLKQAGNVRRIVLLSNDVKVVTELLNSFRRVFGSESILQDAIKAEVPFALSLDETP